MEIKFWQMITKRCILKQAENGLQSRSSENGKTAVWHYGLKLQWYVTGDRDWRFEIVWYGFVGIVWYWGGDYNGLSWIIMKRGHDWHGWLGWMTWMDGWHGWLSWLIGMEFQLILHIDQLRTDRWTDWRLKEYSVLEAQYSDRVPLPLLSWILSSNILASIQTLLRVSPPLL